VLRAGLSNHHRPHAFLQREGAMPNLARRCSERFHFYAARAAMAIDNISREAMPLLRYAPGATARLGG
jgi:hypothetical protein